MKNLLIAALALWFFIGHAQAENSQNDTEKAELAQMLAPIALYPDTLLTHILIASTYPIELVQAQRWQDKHPEPSTKKLEKAVENKDWDPSVKALLPFPKVVQRLNDDLDWTQQLGDAFLEDEAQVLATIQLLRRKAEAVGTLSKMENMEVSHDKRNIIIQPIQREVVYVPYYDTRVVYGNWYWAHYPPIYWRRPHHYYAVHQYQPFYWHSGVHISVNFFFGGFHWGNRHVVVINNYNTHRYVNNRKIISSHGAKRWQHKPVHRRGVAYKSTIVKQRYHSNRPVISPSKSRHLSAKKQTKHSVNHSGKQVVKNRAYEVNKSQVNGRSVKYAQVKHTQIKHSQDKHRQFKDKLASAKTHKVASVSHKQKEYRQSQSKQHVYKNTEQSYKASNSNNAYKATKSASTYKAPKSNSSYKSTNSHKSNKHNTSYKSKSSHKVASSSKHRQTHTRKKDRH